MRIKEIQYRMWILYFWFLWFKIVVFHHFDAVDSNSSRWLVFFIFFGFSNLIYNIHTCLLYTSSFNLCNSKYGNVWINTMIPWKILGNLFKRVRDYLDKFYDRRIFWMYQVFRLLSILFMGLTSAKFFLSLWAITLFLEHGRPIFSILIPIIFSRCV